MFPGFLIWEFPTVYIAQKLRVAKYLGTHVHTFKVFILVLNASTGANVIVWGVILMLHAVTTSFRTFFALRFLLGECSSCILTIMEFNTGFKACANVALHPFLF